MAIHLLSVKKARIQLISGLSGKEQANYWLAFSLLGLAYSYQSGWIGFQWSWVILIDLVTITTITWVGVSECNKVNESGDRRDLILRLAVLGVPLGIRFWFATLVFYAVNWYGFPYFMRTGLFANPDRAWHFLTFFLFNGLAALFWWRMHLHIGVLNRLIKEARRVGDNGVV